MSETHGLPRYHGLDSLRAAMMLLGIALHGGMPYMATAGIPWPFKDPYTNRGFDLLVVLIHMFRMPVFFMMAGFFAAFLYIERGELQFIQNRTKKILQPFAVFWPVLFTLTASAFWYAQGETGQRTEATLVAFGSSLLRSDPWVHLWFLYDLLFLYLAALVVVRLPIPCAVSRGLDRVIRRALVSPFKAVWLAIVLMFTLIPMRTGMLDTDTSWVPLAPYTVVFAFGWFLYRARDLLQAFTKGAWNHLMLGFLLFPVALRMIVRLRTGAFESALGMHFAAAVASGLVIALLVMATTGLFLRYLDSYNRFVRYFTDASYWIYLVHLPVAIWISGFLVRFEAPAPVKFLGVQVTTAAVAVISYHYFVRATFIGEMLNGRRYPRSLPSVTLAAVSSGERKLAMSNQG